MSRVRLIMLSLFAMFAMSAVAASASAAAPCLKVVEAGTGEFENSTCAGVAGTKEWIKAIPATQLKVGEWCARVATPGKGNKDASCVTNAGLEKNEYIKVKALAWQVCEEHPGAGKEPPPKYDEHKCNTQHKALAERKWEWKYLEEGKEYKIKSKGLIQILKVPGAGIEIECSAVTDVGTIKGGVPGTDEATSIKYTGCVVLKPAACKVKTAGLTFGNITVSNVKTELVNIILPAAIGDKFFTASGTFVELELGKKENAVTKAAEEKCGTLPIKSKVEGAVVGKVETGAGGNLGEKINFTTPPQEGSNLTVLGFAAEYIGVVEQELENEWAFRAS